MPTIWSLYQILENITHPLHFFYFEAMRTGWPAERPLAPPGPFTDFANVFLIFMLFITES